MANEYASLADLKLAIQETNSDRDALLNKALEAASRAIDDLAGRRFYTDTSATVRVYSPAGRVLVDEDGDRLLVDDIATLTDLVVQVGSGGSYTTVAAAEYETKPDNAIAEGRPITSLLRLSNVWAALPTTRVRVTARWGWPAVPPQIAQAALIQASRLYRRKDSPEGVLGSAEWGTVRLSRVDPDVAALIAPFALPGFG